MDEEERKQELLNIGKSKIKELQKSHYLHNAKVHYETMSTFEPIDINIMNNIMNRIIKVQEKREMEFLKKFFSGESYDKKTLKELTNELNNIFNLQNHSALINSNLDTIIDDALKKMDLGTRKRVSKRELRGSTELVVKGLIEKSFTNECTRNEIEAHLGSQIAEYFKKTNYDSNVKRFKENLTNSWKNDWEKSTLEYVVTDMLNEVLRSTGQNIQVESTGTKTRQEGSIGKMQKADNILLQFGISDKNYNSIKNSNSGTVTLHTDGELSNFYELINNFNSDGENNYEGVKRLAKKFQKDDFIYHLINGAAHMGGKRNDSGGKLVASGADNPRTNNSSAPAINLITFIKKCLPLFMGTQLKIAGNETNIDFFNINGTFVPASEILKEVFSDKKRGKIFKNRIGLYSNYAVNWDEMLKNKKESDEEYFYSSKVQSVGGETGDEFYKKMKVGRMHLVVALKNLTQG